MRVGVGLAIAFIFASCAAGGCVTHANAIVLTRPPAQLPILVQMQSAPKTETILRKTIVDLQEGRPDFESMEPALQQAVREQAAHTADIYRHLGPLQSLKYIGTRDGTDIYRAVYENAAVTYTIRLSPSGKIGVLLLQPAFPWE